MYELEIEQTFNAPIEKVFSAWTQTEVIKSWFAPGDMTVPEASAEPIAGGRYRIVMQDPGGEQHIVAGEFREVSPHNKLVFTWQWQDSPNTTLVAVDLEAIDETTTKLTLNHSEFVEVQFRDKHEQGWKGCLANLHKVA